MLSAGDILDGKYEVVRVLGKGGMGTVYLCRNKRLDYLWSIKEVSREVAEKSGFLVEPNILKQLNHPGIPRIIDIFEERDKLYMVMDYIEGETLEAYVKRAGGLSERGSLEIILQLCDIFEYLHSFNPPIIYRDLKPSNVIVTPMGRVKLIDFGISRIYKENQDRDTRLMGSSGYAAPEQYGGAQSGIQTDIYGLGATLYFMAAGEAPPLVVDFDHDKHYGVKISEGLGRIIEASMKFNPEERYANVKLFRESVKRAIGGSEDRTVFMGAGNDKTAFMGAKGKEKIRIDKKGGRKKLMPVLIGFTLFVILLSAIIAYAIRSSGQKKAEEAPKPPVNKEAVEDNTKKPVENIIKDINITGVIFKNSPMVLGSSTQDKGKKKKGREDEGKALLYALNPQAESGILENKLLFKIESLEVQDNNIYLYCTINNKTGRDIGIYKSQTILSSSNGDSRQADEMTVIKDETLSDGTRQHKFKLRFKDIGLTGSSYSLKASLSLKGDVQENKVLNLRVEVK